MKKIKNKIKNDSKRILALSLTLCVNIALFAGCSFSSSDVCTDPNCTSCSHVVYASEYDVEATAYVDCPDCTGGGSYVTTTSDCSTCGGDGEVLYVYTGTCTTCLGTGEVEYEGETCGYCFGSGIIWSTCTVCGGDGWTDDDRICNNCTSGTMSTTCTHCFGTGSNSSSTGSCLECGGDGEKNYSSYVLCTVDGCDEGTITTTTRVVCSTCNGYGGWTVDDVGVGCADCNYTGLEDCPECNGYGYYDFGGVNYTCSYCGGTHQRVDSSGSVCGSGKVPCSSCSETSYYDVTFINSYGDECIVYAESGSVIPEYPALSLYSGKTVDDYYLSSDEAGENIVSKSATVTADRTVYVNFYVDDVVETYSVYFYEYTDGWLWGSSDLVVVKTVDSSSTFPNVDEYCDGSYYYLSYDKAGTELVKDSDVVTSDIKVYINIYETGSVEIEYWTYTLMGSNTSYCLEDSEVLSIGDSLTPPDVSDLEVNSTVYEFVGWQTFEPTGTFGTVAGLHGSDSIIDIDNTVATTSVKLYAIYDSEEDIEGVWDSLNLSLNSIFGAEYSDYVQIAFYAIIIIAILLVIAVIKFIFR